LKPGAAQHIREQLYNPPLVPSALTPRAPMSNSPIRIAPTILLSVTATSAPVLTSTASTPQPYVVQQGDTLFSLALRYSVSVEDIQRVNGLTDDNIYVGQQLIIPTP
jgi:LysM repeat protein